MIDILRASTALLGEAGFLTSSFSIDGRKVLVFEDPTVVGFLITYDDATALIDSWERDADVCVKQHQFGLRRALRKAWNAYVVLLATKDPDFSQSVTLNAIEEDLVGTRKIARAGITDLGDLRGAFLPLLPLQSAPTLEAVDIVAEIRERATELPLRSVDAFLSTAKDTVVLQLFEETS